MVPTLIDSNEGKFFNSNCPPKSLKLYSPMLMDSKDGQFDMEKDFDSL